MKHDLPDYIATELDMIAKETDYYRDFEEAKNSGAENPYAWALGCAISRLDCIKRLVDTIRRRAQERRVSPATEFITAHDLLGLLDDEAFQAAPGLEVRLNTTLRLRSKIRQAIKDEVANLNGSIYVPEGP